MIDVFIVASKGIPAQYGGFETFVEQLTKEKVSQEIKYHVSCMNNDEKHFEYNDADCFNVRVPLKGALGRILHVSRALKQVEREYNPEHQTIVYVLGCRIGPLMRHHYAKLHKKGIQVFVNPDGLEWKRDKWNALEKRILKFCEKCLVTNSDLVICDSKNIETYIKESYGPKIKETTYIAYGSYLEKSTCVEETFRNWIVSKNISPNGYYLIVGRFVPENNYDTMISEFLKSKTNKDLVIITNVEKNKFYRDLQVKTGFDKDSRIKFVGTVYDQELLKRIREEAFGYLHGHEVGGTNPSLLEALGSTKINMLLDVPFNREVAEDGALYWNKENMSLANLIEKVDGMSSEEIEVFEEKARQRIADHYSWESIISQYEHVILNQVEDLQNVALQETVG